MQEFKIEQVAYHVKDIDEGKRHFEHALGLAKENWIDDTVVAMGKIAGCPLEQLNKAHLTFNYQVGLELELIQYVEGVNWHSVAGRVGNNFEPFSVVFPSHLGMHVTSLVQMGEWITQMKKAGISVAQEVETLSHTNPVLVNLKQYYHYVVFNSRHLLGFDLKLIRRMVDNAD